VPPSPFSTSTTSDYTVTTVATRKTSARYRVIGQRSNSPSPIAPATHGKWRIKNSRGLKIVQSAELNGLPWLIHGFSTRPGGASKLAAERVLNLGFTDWDEGKTVQQNRDKFQKALGTKDFALIPLRQIHSAVIHPFESAPAQHCPGDASISNRSGLLLATQTADCVPILLVDPRSRAIAAIHAGWKGTLNRIAQKTAGEMRKHFGSNPKNLLAAIGPAIGGCCYEVGTEIAANFLSQFANAPEWFDEFRTGDEPNPVQWLNMKPPGHQPPPQSLLLDLRKANRAQLVDAGLQPQNIFVSDLCTACRRDLFFSHRKEAGHTGRHMSVVGISN